MYAPFLLLHHKMINIKSLPLQLWAKPKLLGVSFSKRQYHNRSPAELRFYCEQASLRRSILSCFTSTLVLLNGTGALTLRSGPFRLEESSLRLLDLYCALIYTLRLVSPSWNSVESRIGSETLSFRYSLNGPNSLQRGELGSLRQN